jgi:hypothetical protein
LEEYFSQKYDVLYNMSIVSEEGKLSKIAGVIYENYLKSFN